MHEPFVTQCECAAGLQKALKILQSSGECDFSGTDKLSIIIPQVWTAYESERKEKVDGKTLTDNEADEEAWG